MINQVLRLHDMLLARAGPFGEMLDTFESPAFAVCDHQVAHVYVRDPDDRDAVRETLGEVPGIDRIYVGEERAELGLDHPRSGELVALARPEAWFAYPYWLDDRDAPDFARTVDIHRKPGYDPCELFLDPTLTWPQGRVLFRLLLKKLGFRTRFDVIPLDPTLVRGSHGRPALLAEDRPILIGDGPPPGDADSLPMTGVHGLLLDALDCR
jgi:hypothetical protein